MWLLAVGHLNSNTQSHYIPSWIYLFSSNACAISFYCRYPQWREMRKSPSKSLYSLSITPKVIPFYSTSPCGSCWPNICSYHNPKKSSWISPSPSPSPLTSDNQATSPTATYRIQSKCTPSLSLSHCSHHRVSLTAAVTSIILPDFKEQTEWTLKKTLISHKLETLGMSVRW